MKFYLRSLLIAVLSVTSYAASSEYENARATTRTAVRLVHQVPELLDTLNATPEELIACIQDSSPKERKTLVQNLKRLERSLLNGDDDDEQKVLIAAITKTLKKFFRNADTDENLPKFIQCMRQGAQLL